VIPNRKRKVLQNEARKHVIAGAALYADALMSYKGLASDYAHQVVDHATQYVDGRVNTNGLENFWSLLKRGIGRLVFNQESPGTAGLLDSTATPSRQVRLGAKVIF
jgi:hypothetical protein